MTRLVLDDCTGHEVGCTCDIDWDELREAQRAGGVV